LSNDEESEQYQQQKTVERRMEAEMDQVTTAECDEPADMARTNFPLSGSMSTGLNWSS